MKDPVIEIKDYKQGYLTPAINGWHTSSLVIDGDASEQLVESLKRVVLAAYNDGRISGLAEGKNKP